MIAVRRTLILLVFLTMTLGLSSPASALPKGAGACVGTVSVTFSPPLGLIDAWGTAVVQPVDGACGGAGPGCFPDSSVCECPIEDVELCAMAGLVGEGGEQVMDYFGSCARAYLDGGWIQITGGTLVEGALVFGELPDVGVFSINGIATAEGGNPCAMERAVCACTILMLLQMIG